MILARYISRRFLLLIEIVLLTFFGILLLIDIIEQLRRFSRTDLAFSRTLQLALVHVPETLYRILPLVFIIAAVALFLALARSSELVVVRATGQSGLRFLTAPVAVALIAGALAVAVFNPLVAATSRAYADLRAQYASDGQSVLSIADSGFWLRQGDATGQTVIHARRTNRDGTVLADVTFLSFGDGGMPVTRTDARRAELIVGAWRLEGAKRWDLMAANPERAADHPPDGSLLPSDLTPERIRDSFGTPSAVPIWKLPSYITSLQQAGFSARSYRIWFQMELALPFTLAAMVLIAAAFTMRHARAGRAAGRVLGAILCGFALFFLRDFAQALGDSGQIPVILAAWSPPAVALFLAIGFLLHLEDG